VTEAPDLSLFERTPYVLALLVGLLLLILIPEITLFLPRQAGAVR